MGETSTEIRSLGVQSKRGALLTILSLSLVVGSILYSIFSLKELEQGRDTLLLQLQQLRERSEELKTTITGLETKREKMVEEITGLEEKYAGLKKSVEQVNVAIGASDGKASVALKVAGQRVYEIKSSAMPTGQKTNSGPLYDFKLYVSGSDEVLNDMEKVTYIFDHPTFMQKTQTATDRIQQFSIGYRGWGCLREVGITVKFKDGVEGHSDFDMCKSLGWVG